MNQFQLNNIYLLMMGVDNVICPAFTNQLTPEARSFFEWYGRQTNKPESIALISNQGGVGLRYWMEQAQWGQPEQYPTQEQADRRLVELGQAMAQLSGVQSLIARCYAYYTPRSDSWAPLPKGIDPDKQPEWSRAWRMPNTGMLKYILETTGFEPKDAFFIWANREEQMACQKLGIRHVEADQFWRHFHDTPWQAIYQEPHYVGDYEEEGEGYDDDYDDVA